jgi:hypothetical protein
VTADVHGGHPEVIGAPRFAAGNTRAAHTVELDAYMASWIVDELAALHESGVV